MNLNGNSHGGLFYKGSHLIHGSTLRTWSPLKGPHLLMQALGSVLQSRNCGDRAQRLRSLHEQKRDTDTKEKPHANGGRDRREAATSQRIPGAPRSWEAAGRTLPWNLQREHSSAHTCRTVRAVLSGSRPPGLWSFVTVAPGN